MIKEKSFLFRLGVMMLLAIFFSGALVTVPVVDAEDEVKPIQLSLAEAQKRALVDNSRMELAEVGVQKARFGITKARRNVDNIDDMRSGSGGMAGYDFSTSLGRAIAVPKAESDLRVAQRELEHVTSELEKDVASDYYNLLKATTELDIAKKKLESARTQLKHAQTSFSLGLIAKNELLMAELGVANAEVGPAGLLVAENSYQEARMKMAKQLAMPLTTEFNLTSTFDLKPREIDVEKAVESTLENNLNLVKAMEGLEVLKLQFEFAGRYYTPNVYEYRDAEYAYKETKISVENLIDDMEVAVRTIHLNIANFPERLQVVTKATEQAEENLRLQQLRYETGLATSKDVLDAIVSLSEAKQNYNSTVYSYNTLLADFKLMTGLDI